MFILLLVFLAAGCLGIGKYAARKKVLMTVSCYCKYNGHADFELAFG